MSLQNRGHQTSWAGPGEHLHSEEVLRKSGEGLSPAPEAGVVLLAGESVYIWPGA